MRLPALIGIITTGVSVDIRYRQEEAFLVATLYGRLETIAATEVERRLLEKIGEGNRKLVLDLSETEYISSAGLRVLLVTAKTLGRSGGTFRLCAATPENLQVLEMVGFLNVMEYVDTLEEALIS